MFIKTEAFLNIGTKSCPTSGTVLVVFLGIFFWLVSAEFKKTVGGFGWIQNKSWWFRVVLARSGGVSCFSMYPTFYPESLQISSFILQNIKCSE